MLPPVSRSVSTLSLTLSPPSLDPNLGAPAHSPVSFFFLFPAATWVLSLLLTMVLYVIGLGLGDEKDITVRGLEAVRGSAKVVLEHYTSILGVDKAKLVSARK